MWFVFVRHLIMDAVLSIEEYEKVVTMVFAKDNEENHQKYVCTYTNSPKLSINDFIRHLASISCTTKESKTVFI